MTLAPLQPPPTDARPRTRAEAAAVRQRLRRLIADIESRPPRRHTPTPEPPRPFDPDDPPRNLLASATRRATASGPFTTREVRYPIQHIAGHQPLADIAALSPQTLELLAPDEGLEDARLQDLYFLDIETTGLGGAGAIAFLVATARFDVDHAGHPADLVLTQYLAESPPEENALLEALIEDARFPDEPVLVTYNGRTFDAPLLDERATMHRRRAGFDNLRQLDLLRPARRAYRSLLPNCKLNTLEHHVLGMTRPSEDVPGAEVPHWYFRFLRTGDHRMLSPIVEHNELDIIGMVGLLAWHAAHLDDGRSPAPRDALGLGRLLASEGDATRAIVYLEHALAPPFAATPSLPVASTRSTPVASTRASAAISAPSSPAHVSPAEPAPSSAETPASSRSTLAASTRASAAAPAHKPAATPASSCSAPVAPPPSARTSPRTSPAPPPAPVSVSLPDGIARDEPPPSTPAASTAPGNPAAAASPRAAALAHAGETAYHSAARPPLVSAEDPLIQEEALLRLATLYKRAGDRPRAAELWHRALDLPARAPLEPLIQLAMHYEHHERDFDAAISHAARAHDHLKSHLHPHDHPRSNRLLEAIEHRLARLHSRAERARQTA